LANQLVKKNSRKKNEKQHIIGIMLASILLMLSFGVALAAKENMAMPDNMAMPVNKTMSMNMPMSIP